MTSLTRLSLANRLIVGLAALAVVVFGVVATTSLRQELLPSTDVPTAAVTATYPGASPEIVADEVAGPLEQAISGVDGVTTVRATSTNGVASLVVEWDFGLDSDEVTSEIRSAVDGVPDLPDEVETEVLAISTDDIPVQVVAVASDTPITELGRLVDEIAIPQLTEVDGVRQVQVAGQNVTELAVTLAPGRAAQVRHQRGGGHPGDPGAGPGRAGRHQLRQEPRAGDRGRDDPDQRQSRSPSGRSRRRTGRSS